MVKGRWTHPNRRRVAFRVLARTQGDARNRLQRLRLDRRDALESTPGYRIGDVLSSHLFPSGSVNTAIEPQSK
jgi:hypothetical protein